MISQVLREDFPDNDPAPYIPTFYQFSDFIEHNPAADVSIATVYLAVYEYLLLSSGAFDATAVVSLVFSCCT